ncbi:uncharacterized protein TNCV_3351371 [Trichonephila clavipes]|nr:uncharacterized protein TNCV_3351371 [Trichonephila clavipes]
MNYANRIEDKQRLNGYLYCQVPDLTDGLSNGLLCKAVSTYNTFVFIMSVLPDRFLTATDPVSRNRCPKSVIIDVFGAVSPGYFC